MGDGYLKTLYTILITSIKLKLQQNNKKAEKVIDLLFNHLV